MKESELPEEVFLLFVYNCTGTNLRSKYYSLDFAIQLSKIDRYPPNEGGSKKMEEKATSFKIK